MAEDKGEPKQRTAKGLEIPVPKREQFVSFVEKVAGRAGRKRPGDSGQPPKQSQ